MELALLVRLHLTRRDRLERSAAQPGERVDRQRAQQQPGRRREREQQLRDDPEAEAREERVVFADPLHDAADEEAVHDETCRADDRERDADGALVEAEAVRRVEDPGVRDRIVREEGEEHRDRERQQHRTRSEEAHRADGIRGVDAERPAALRRQVREVAYPPRPLTTVPLSFLPSDLKSTKARLAKSKRS